MNHKSSAFILAVVLLVIISISSSFANPSITDLWNFTPYTTILHFGVQDLPSDLGLEPTFEFTFNNVQLGKSVTLDVVTFNDTASVQEQILSSIKTNANTSPTISLDVAIPKMTNSSNRFVGFTFEVSKFVSTTYSVSGTVSNGDVKYTLASDFKLASASLAQSLDLKMPYQSKPTLLNFDIRNLAVDLAANSTLSLSIRSGLGQTLQPISFNKTRTDYGTCTVAGHSVEPYELLSNLMIPVPVEIAAGTESVRIKCDNMAVNSTTLNLGYTLKRNLDTQIVLQFSNFTEAQRKFIWLIVILIIVLIIGFFAAMVLFCYCCKCCCFKKSYPADPEYYSFHH